MRSIPLTVVCVLTSFFIGLFCTGCSSTASPSSTPINVSTASVAFPTTAVGDTTTSVVTLSTTSEQTIGLSDSDTADFPYSTNCAVSMPAGSSCSIYLQFHPMTVGALSAFLTVNTTGATKGTPIALTGTAVGTAPTFNPSSPVTLLQIITVEPNPFYLSPGQTSQLMASAASTTGGAQDVTSVANWTSSDPGVVSVSPTGLVTAIAGGTANISVTYLGHSASIRVAVVGSMTIAPTSFAFPPTSVGQTSASPTFTLTFSTGPNMIGTIVSSDPSEFFVENSTCDQTAVHSAGYTCTMVVGFTPAVSGARTAQLIVTSAQAPTNPPATITLTGTGQ